ncbi:MAG: DNA internalization-related competence protein ComEC/Rec2 [Deltaproteobacteria bacterium]|nr:DNA internalization-related competence protein ComEC/Rec2 [Deltaproteobacteria bacterium]
MRPIVPVLASFIAGIIVSGRLLPSYEAAYMLLALSVCAPALACIIGSRFSRPLACMPFFFLGLLFILPHVKPDLPQNHIKNFIPKERAVPANLRKAEITDIEGVIRGSPVVEGDNVRYLVDAKRVNGKGQWGNVTGAVLLTMSGDEARFDAGDTVRFLARLKEPSNYGNPGEYDYKWRMNSRGIYATAFVKSERMIVKTGEGDSGIFSIPAKMRSRVRSFMDSTGARNDEALKALTIAEKGGLPRDIRDAFAKTGAAHILVISGLHMGMAAVFFYSLITFTLKRSERLMLAINVRRAALALTLLPVVGYGLLAGFPLPTQRAVIMAAVFVFTMLLEKGKDMINALALAAIIILAMEPGAVWDIAFQLSFAAVFFIIYLAPRLTERLGGLFPEKDKASRKAGSGWKVWLLARVRRWLIPACSVTFAATLGTAPILAYHFNMVSIIGAAANVIAVPIAGVIVPLLLSSMAVMPFWEGLARAGVYLADKLFDLMAAVIKLFAGLPYASVRVATPALTEMILAYLLIIFTVNFKKARVYRFLTAFVLVAIIADAGYWALRPRGFSPFKRSRELKVTFLSVGQGESAVVELPGGKVMLIDGGGIYGTDFDTGERLVAPFLRHEKIGTVDYMVLSHAQRDHMAGLNFIAGDFHVKEFWWNGDGDLGELKDTFKKAGAEIKVLSARTGEMNIGGVRVEALSPSDGQAFDQNNKSLVLRLTYGDKSFLFTGDIGFPAEEYLAGRDVRAAVLKAPHHGSRYSSSAEFLSRVRPAVVVASAGRGNVFGFPHPDTIKRYDAVNAKFYRTDRDGAVTVGTDGAVLSVSTYLTEMPP